MLNLGRQDSNLRPLAPEANALLRLSYAPLNMGETGFEPAIPAFQMQCDKPDFATPPSPYRPDLPGMDDGR